MLTFCLYMWLLQLYGDNFANCPILVLWTDICAPLVGGGPAGLLVIFLMCLSWRVGGATNAPLLFWIPWYLDAKCSIVSCALTGAPTADVTSVSHAAQSFPTVSCL